MKLVQKRYKTFHELYSDQNTDSVAFLFEENNVLSSITYKEFIKKIDEYKIEKDKHSIGIFLNQDINSIVAFFAYAKAKKQIVLLNQNDDCDLLKEQIIATDIDFLIGPSSLINNYSGDLKTDNNITDNNGNILFFTSGTTSSNKAVILSEESLCASAYNGGYLLPLKEEDTFLSLLPLSHVFGFVCNLLWPLSFGAKIALGRGYKYLPFDCSFFHPSVITLVPTLANFLLKNNLINKELKLVLIGAANCSKEIIMQLENRDITVAFGYGLSECSSGVALGISPNSFSLKICPDFAVKIAEDGEILISSPLTMMKGYYKDQSSTDSVLTNNVLHTGDLGYIDDEGFLHINGRKKDIIVLENGTKIFCLEYENYLGKFLPNVDFAIGESSNKIILYVYDENRILDINKIVNEFNLHLERDKRIAKIKYLSSPLKRTQTGKIKRWMLIDN